MRDVVVSDTCLWGKYFRRLPDLVHQVTAFARSLPQFSSLTDIDQCILVKNGILEVTCILLTSGAYVDDNGLNVPLLKIFIPKEQRQMQELNQRKEITVHEMVNSGPQVTDSSILVAELKKIYVNEKKDQSASRFSQNVPNFGGLVGVKTHSFIQNVLIVNTPKIINVTQQTNNLHGGNCSCMKCRYKTHQNAEEVVNNNLDPGLPETQVPQSHNMKGFLTKLEKIWKRLVSMDLTHVELALFAIFTLFCAGKYLEIH